MDGLMDVAKQDMALAAAGGLLGALVVTGVAIGWFVWSSEKYSEKGFGE